MEPGLVAICFLWGEVGLILPVACVRRTIESECQNLKNHLQVYDLSGFSEFDT